MRSISLIFKQLSRSILLVAGLGFMGLSAHAQADAAKGGALFKLKCATCHKIEGVLIGPGLGPIVSSETDEKWLTKWIQNNQALIAAKDAKALKIYNEFEQKGMPVFPEIADADAANIIAYVKGEHNKPVDPGAGKGTAVSTEDSGPSDLVIFGLIGIVILAFIVILVLNKVIGTLERLLLKKQGLLSEDDEEGAKVTGDRLATIKRLAKNKKLVFFIVLCGVIGSGSWAWVTMWNTNVHQGYQPVQPIKYSHELHAGTMKIACQYCHSGAYKSKNASIPSLNICMNCHKVVKTESPEIHKIYDALGYDPATAKYDTTKAHPIAWVRVHNLPDFAYFNHSQHVRVAGIKCQQCHGPIETMKEVRQYSPLTMKWCVQCHKRTDVNTKGNAYYDDIIKVHDKLKRGERLTAAALGGLECGKCHY